MSPRLAPWSIGGWTLAVLVDFVQVIVRIVNTEQPSHDPPEQRYTHWNSVATRDVQYYEHGLSEACALLSFSSERHAARARFGDRGTLLIPFYRYSLTE